MIVGGDSLDDDDDGERRAPISPVVNVISPATPAFLAPVSAR